MENTIRRKELWTKENIKRFQRLCKELDIKDSPGKAVEFVQILVGAVPIDGDFGAITKNCVMDYQRNKNIEAMAS